jgi:ABC-type branched-subunit amino acid transport system substrate-binding protein
MATPKFRARIAFLAGVALIFAPSVSKASSYLIGVPVPLSGPRKARGEMLVRSLQIKADEINADGGVDGHKIELLVRDDAGEADTARKVAAQMAADSRVLAVVGHYDTEPAAAAAPVYAESRLPAFLPSIGDARVMGHSSWIFSGTYAASAEAQTLAVFIKAIRLHTSVVVLYTADDYGRDMWRAFSAKAPRIGLKARGIEFPSEEAGQKLSDDFVARNLPSAPAGVQGFVVFGHSDNGGALIRQLREHKMHLPVYGSSRVASGDLLEKLGPYTEDLHAAYPFMFDFGSQKAIDFRQEYLKRNRSEPNVFGLFAYDGLGMIAEAIRTAGPDRTAIRDYLASFNSPTTTFEGASGLLYFGKDGAAVRDTIMGTIMGGQFHPCYEQLRVVTEAHTLSILPEKVKLGEVIVVDDIPFFLINVVYAGIEWYRIDQLNVKDLNFDAEFFLWLKWSGNVDVENVQFLNEVPGKGYRIEMRRATVPAGAHGGQDIQWISYRIKGTFLHSYDLHQFPFDRQEIPLLLAHKNRNANKIQIVADAANIVDRPIEAIYPQEWKYIGRRDFSTTFRYASAFGNPTYLPGEAQAPYSVYRSTLRIHRLLFPYLVTLFLPLGILIFVSLLSLLIPKEQFSTRNSLVMSSLLGVLVYHMAQARALPQVGYLMKADLYFVVAYLLIAILVLGINGVNLLVAHKQEHWANRLDQLLDRFFIIATLVAYTALTVSGLLASR